MVSRKIELAQRLNLSNGEGEEERGFPFVRYSNIPIHPSILIWKLTISRYPTPESPGFLSSCRLYVVLLNYLGTYSST